MAAKIAGKTRKVSKSLRVSKVETTDSSPARVGMTLRRKLFLIIIVLALAYVLFSSKDLFVAATVNGFPLSRISVVRELEKQGGKQVLDNLVSEMLIAQEARKAGITVSAEDIDAKVNSLKEQMSAQGQDIDALLATQGISQEEFRDQIKTQLFVEKLLTDKISITDEKVAEFIETNKAYLPTDLDEEALKKLAREELTQQELSTQYSTWISEIKQNSDINYFVEY